MAFFVVTLIWIGLSADRKYLTFLLLIFAGLVLTVERLDPEVRDLAYSVTVGRFNLAKSEDRLLKGDNRTAIMKQNYQAFADAPIIGHGLHYEDYIAGVYGASFIGNPVAPLARNGIFGAILMNLHVFALFLILLATKRLTRRDKLLLLLVLSATLAQRPITINGFGYFLFIIMIYQLAACDTSVTTSRQNV
jgi:hypothetical protein